MSSGTGDFVDVFMPQLEGAFMLRAYADLEAVRNQAYADQGAWYHRAWGFLRIADCVSTPTWHAQFYETAFRNARQSAGLFNMRVLVSGTADYTMPAVVAAAVAGANITVADISQPPLNICEWWAQRERRPIHTLRHNILADWSGGTFDVITADAFLTRFSRQDVTSVLQRWRAMLAPGGLVVTTVRVREGIKSADRGRGTFIGRARSFYGRAMGKPQLGSEVCKLAHTYSVKMQSNNHGGRADILNLFEQNDFHVLHHEIGDTHGEYQPTRYARIIARKATRPRV